MNLYDHYSEAKRLVRLLREDGLTTWANGIESAMDEGSTGTEIFMMLKMQVKNYLASNQGSAVAIECANRLFEQLNEALK